MNYSRKRKPITSAWPVEHDCFLIENSHLQLEALQQTLPYSAQEIQDRQEILGLTRRRRQMEKLGQF